MQRPVSIVYPTDYMTLIENSEQLELIENFTSDLETSFGVKRRSISLTALWNSSPPAKANGESLQDFMKYVRVLFQECINNFMLLGLSELLFP